MKGWEKIAVGIAGVAFAIALIWGVLTVADTPEIPVADVNAEGFDHERSHSEGLSEEVEWGKPPPQGGPNWIFDIFTPPVIFYDEAMGTFTVTPPFREVAEIADAFELRLLGIRQEPYRFQLVSYAGTPGKYVLTLENIETGQDVFCAPGETLAEHRIQVDRFMETREVPAALQEGSTEVFDLVGQATITDLHTRQTHLLRHSQIAYLDQPSAVFSNPEGMQIVLRLGESWRSSNAIYILSGIDADNWQVTVEKSSLVGGDKLQKILQPAHDDNSSDPTVHLAPGSGAPTEVF